MVKGGDGFDEADGADGDEVLLVGGLGVVLLHHVGHQAQVVLNERVPGGQVPGGGPLQAVPLLLRPQGPGEGAPAGEAQGQKQAVGEEQQRG